MHAVKFWWPASRTFGQSTPQVWRGPPCLEITETGVILSFSGDVFLCFVWVAIVIAVAIAIGVPDMHRHPTTLVLEAAGIKRKERKKENTLNLRSTVYVDLVLIILGPAPSEALPQAIGGS
jgi:hypothetical protein